MPILASVFCKRQESQTFLLCFDSGGTLLKDLGAHARPPSCPQFLAMGTHFYRRFAAVISGNWIEKWPKANESLSSRVERFLVTAKIIQDVLAVR